MLLIKLPSILSMAKDGLFFLAGASAASFACIVMSNIRNQRRIEVEQAAAKRILLNKQALPVAQVPSVSEVLLTHNMLPKAELIISAGPRKSTRETELGEDIAGTVLTPNRIIFWVLDGTSDTVVIPGEQGRDLFSSRLFCLAISAALHRIAHNYSDAQVLAVAALKEASIEIQSQIESRQDAFQRFGDSEPRQTPHWDVSTTMLLGVLSALGEVDLFRIGDSKAICFDDKKQVVPTVIDMKPASIGLGRVHARLVRGEVFTLELYVPDRSEQLHRGRASGVSRVIAFSDGVGPNTEQYIRRMLAQRTYAQFHDELAHTPNNTYDDKTLVLASFEPMS